MKQIISVLVLDDDPHFLTLMERMIGALSEFSTCVVKVTTSKEAIQKFEKQAFIIAFIDLSLQGEETAGVKFLEKITLKYPETEFIVHSSQQSFHLAQKCIRAGASDYLLKGYGKEEFKMVFQRALDRAAFKKQKFFRKIESKNELDKYKILGISPGVQKLKMQIAKLAKSDASILIEAETGSGKELVARNLHYQSQYAENSFVAIDCATIPSSMAEGFLFGHEKGAFTGASEMHIGVFEQANGGTLFLDEITSLSMDLQLKFLRVLEEKEIRRVGGLRNIPVQFRLLAAGNQSLEELVKKKQFKEDLYYRLQAIILKIPPLRERREDIPLFLEYFLQGRELSSALQQVMCRHSWPGNIRECRNLCTALLALAGEDSPIDIIHLPENILHRFQQNGSLQVGGNSHLKDWKIESEKDYLRKVYEETGENISAMARKLKVDRSHLFSKLKKMGIHKTK